MPDGDAKSLPAVEVLVNLSLDRTFDYLIPPHLIGRIQPGMKVNVPFGKGRKPRPATVTRLIPRPDRGDLKEIIDICGDVPQIPAAGQVQQAQPGEGAAAGSSVAVVPQ